MTLITTAKLGGDYINTGMVKILWQENISVNILKTPTGKRKRLVKDVFENISLPHKSETSKHDKAVFSTFQSARGDWRDNEGY